MTNLQEILTKLWCAVDVEDVTEELIDIGAIDDAQAAIAELVEKALPNGIDVRDSDEPKEFQAGWNQALNKIRNNLKAKGIL